MDVIKLQKQLETTNYIKSTKFVDKGTAAHELQTELGEDFINFLGYNPLLSSIDVKLYAGYANPDSLARIEKQFMALPGVQEVYYQRDMVKQLHSNVGKISLILLGLSMLMFLIFTALINNMIRLSIYSKRFLINTMQLVGATRSFIRKPFMIKGFLYGIYGGNYSLFHVSVNFYFVSERASAFCRLSESCFNRYFSGRFVSTGNIYNRNCYIFCCK